MAEQATDSVPKAMRPIFEHIVALTDAVCKEHLNDDYVVYSRRLTATLCRKRPSPLLSGRLDIWACGIVYALGSANWLFDRSQHLTMSAQQLCDLFGVKLNTAANRAARIRTDCRVAANNAQWVLPGMLAVNPYIWWITVDGLMIDTRRAPYWVRVEAYNRGLIPYIPVAASLID